MQTAVPGNTYGVEIDSSDSGHPWGKPPTSDAQ
jgi:hypothetical protein